jgi:hypothetical protein
VKIAVVDGMGGSIGAQIVLQLREALPEEADILALGTNAVATGNMMKAKASRGASGENAIAFSIGEAEVIMGSLSIMVPNSMMGEVTPGTATAIASAPGRKILLPVSNPPLEILSVHKKPLQKLIEEAVIIVRGHFGLRAPRKDDEDV